MSTPGRGRGTQTLRQIQIIRYFCQVRTWVTVADVCEAVGVHYRTAYRDLEQLQSIGVPFERREFEATQDGPRAAEWRLTRAAMDRWLWEWGPQTPKSPRPVKAEGLEVSW